MNQYSQLDQMDSNNKERAWLCRFLSSLTRYLMETKLFLKIQSCGECRNRRREGEKGFNRARGVILGRKCKVRREASRKYAPSMTLIQMQHHLVPVVDDPVAHKRVSSPDDPLVILATLKNRLLFLRADRGICELPTCAVYSHNMADGPSMELNHKYAIAILIDQDWTTANGHIGSDWIVGSMSFMVYSGVCAEFS